MSRFLTIAVAVLLIVVSGHGRALAQPQRVREVYVPMEEFQALVAGRPNGVVMPLEEYRALIKNAVAGGLGRAGQLPPVEAALLEATYTGTVRGDSIEFEGQLTLRVLAEGWVRCPLGPVPVGLGRVTVDDQPGWLLVENGVGALLLNGRGTRRVTVRFSAPIVQSDRGESVSSQVFRSPGSILDLSVPGEAKGSAQVGQLETTVENGATRFRLVFGGLDRFAIDWKRQRTSGDQTALVNAQQELVVLPGLEHSPFRWSVRAAIARESVESLRFRLPTGFDVLEVNGPLVHRWESSDSELQVFLKGPTRGDVTIDARGLGLGGETVVVGAPTLLGAYSDRGRLAILDPGTLALRILNASEVEERTPTSDGFPIVPEAGGRAPVRVFEYSRPNPSVTLSLAQPQARFREKCTALLRVYERGVRLDTVLEVFGDAGRMHELDVALPTGWELRSLDELPGTDGAGRIERWELVEAAGNDRVRLNLQRALVEGSSVIVRLALIAPEFGEDRTWESRDLQLALPHAIGVSASRADLAIALEPSLHLSNTSFVGWRSLTDAERGALGFRELLPNVSYETWAATLRNDRVVTFPGGAELGPVPLGFTVIQRSSRGEYRSVTHIVATERTRETNEREQVIEIVTDLVIAVVDRGLDVLTFELPELPEDVQVDIQAEGIQEISRNGRRHTVRFGTPWLGTRRFVVTYEVPYASGQSVPVTVPRVEGQFGAERFVVIASEGSVEIEASPGAALVPVGTDELPDFAVIPEGTRVVSAHRLRSGSELGEFSPNVHVRAPVIGRLAGRMNLTTLISDGGGSRTEVEFVLAYARAQTLTLELSRDATVRAVAIDGEPVSAILPASQVNASGNHRISIPLPPRSFATIRLLYERAETEPWNGEGRFVEHGPTLVGVPIGETFWRVYHPVEFDLRVEGGNVTEHREAAPRFVWETVIQPVIDGQAPRWSFLRREARTVVHAAGTPVTDAERAGVDRRAFGSNSDRNRVRPGVGGRQASAPRVPVDPLVVEGGRLEAYKYGGAAELAVAYRPQVERIGSRYAAFAVTLVIAWLLVFPLSRRTWWRMWIAALSLGAALPIALRQSEPGLFLPMTEALVVFAAPYAVWCLLCAAGLWLRRTKSSKRRVSTVVATTSLLLLACFVRPVHGTQFEIPHDGVIIPYNIEDVLAGKDGADMTAFVPQSRFRELWRAANPGQRPPMVFAPLRVVIGPASYDLRVVEPGRFELVGRFSVMSITDDALTLELPLTKTRLVEAKMDGRPIALEVRPGSAPRMEIPGDGLHEIELTIAGAIQTNSGSSSVDIELLPGTVSEVVATLPLGTVVSAPGHTITTLDAADAVRVRLDTGSRDAVALNWRIPQIEGEIVTQLESVSYTRVQASPDGFFYDRTESLSVTGDEIDRVRYRMTGDGELLDVVGDHISEWRVETVGDEGRVLEIVFENPVRKIQLRFVGLAVVGDSAEFPAFVPEGRGRQEVWVGLAHGRSVRFAPLSLSGLQRATPSELATALGVEGSQVDRLFRGHGSGSGETLAREAVVESMRFEFEGVALREVDRTIVFARFLTKSADRGALGFQVALPLGWRVLRVDAQTIAGWIVRTEGSARSVDIDFRQRLAVGSEIRLTLERVETATETRTALPRLLASTGSGEVAIDRRSWLLAARDELELTSSASDNWRPLDMSALPSWVQFPSGVSARFAYRARRAEDAPVIETQQLPTRTRATSVLFAELGETQLSVNGRFSLNIRFTGRSEYTFRLPSAARLAHFDCVNQRSVVTRETPEGTVVDLTLQSPHRGTLIVDLSYTVARTDADAALTVQPVRLLDASGAIEPVEQYFGIVHTTRTFSIRASVDGIAEVDRESVPYLPNGVHPRSLQKTFRATAADWRADISEDHTPLDQGLAGVVQLADIVTVIGSDGTTRTKATYLLVNRSLQFFGLELPNQTELWGVTVDGRSVAVAQDDSTGSLRIRVPVERGTSSQLPLEVTCYYSESRVGLPAETIRAGLKAPLILPDSASGASVEIDETLWTVHVPSTYAVSEAGDRVQLVPHSLKQARKLQHLLDQQMKVLNAANVAETSRARSQATQELIRLDQALGDNLAELESLGEARGRGAQSRLLAADDLARQWDDNRQLIDKAVRARRSVKEQLEGTDPDSVESADDRAFRDRAAFLSGRSWRRGSKVALDAAPAPGTSRGTPAALLIEGRIDPGWRQLAIAGIGLSSEFVQDTDKPARLSSGGSGLLRRAPIGTQFATPEYGYEAYTYHALAGDVEVELDLRRADRYASWIAWAVVVLALGIALRRRRP